MAFESWREINRIRKNHRDAIYFYANLQERFYTIEENDILPDELDPDDKNLLKAFCDCTCIEETEKNKMCNLYRQIEQGTKEPIKMDDLETWVHLETRSGKKALMAVLCYLEKDEKGLIREYVGMIRIMRKQELENREIVTSFSNDKNPAFFLKKIARFQAEHPEREYAYIQFDVRRFKYINEKYGSDTGDNILRYIYDTLDVMCDEEHLHCRLSADVFQIVTYYNSREEIMEFIDKLDEKIRRYGDIKLSITYGVNIVPGSSTAYRKHGDEAGLARAEGKRTILNKVVFYEDTLMNHVKQTGAIEEVEEEALRREEFQVYLQPKYQYDRSHAKIVGAEALVRWIDANGKCKSPMEFIPVFEANGFIYKLDCFMWEMVCKVIRRWLDTGRQPLPISVNVSRTYLQKEDVAGYIKNLIDKYQIPMELFQLEITETTENAESLSYINSLKQAGFTLLMDDFGSGYSSLCMLKNTPFDVLKMDRQFLDECLDSKQGKTIISHVISMSNDLGLSIIAEGVENRGTADFLYDNGCSVSQGFYFSKPVSIPEFEHMLDEQQTEQQR